MPEHKVFISYRRQDVLGYPQWLIDFLGRHFGRTQVFWDRDIPPGVDFRHWIESTLEHCILLIALIGREWLSASDEMGHKRLNNQHDWVRFEISTALQKGIPVLPVLVYPRAS
ncbi:MAG: toll/interleukin-1 receptor domain-containing protein [Nitrospinales bacterium]